MEEHSGLRPVKMTKRAALGKRTWHLLRRHLMDVDKVEKRLERSKVLIQMKTLEKSQEEKLAEATQDKRWEMRPLGGA